MSEPVFLDMQQLADRYGVSKEWVKIRVKRREIPFTRLPGGRLVRFSREQVAQIDQLGAPEPALNGPLGRAA
ncbi:helix-turn-helix transcriptional regulator [Micromonospora carbonacea]|uniref:DNA binding domain-containing protein, excisionase family n=1 Tax=Micromonospora carbonacea TaxID=47853 RepID=A0A1C5AYU9_9ACTN|nr:helix-turn-helix domain-containing protein [Micromonospora carbonacea]SCF50382.1 DNA binding domain-containing protein, excisionase family [Micromonospora carbonacea]